jgi:hypothetical protein
MIKSHIRKEEITIDRIPASIRLFLKTKLDITAAMLATSRITTVPYIRYGTSILRYCVSIAATKMVERKIALANQGTRSIFFVMS